MEGEVGSLGPMLEKLGCLMAKRNGLKMKERGRHLARSEGKIKDGWNGVVRERESWVKEVEYLNWIDEKGGKTVEEGEGRGMLVSREDSMWDMVLCSADSILFA